jgi:predicted ester cyclase
MVVQPLPFAHLEQQIRLCQRPGWHFQRGLETYPELHFNLKDVLAGLNSLVLYYTNQKGTRTGEFMDLGGSGKVTRVVAHYSI